MKVILALQAEMKNWIEAGKNRSLLSLSRKASVSYSTVRRIEKGKGLPHFATIRKLLEVMFGEATRIHSWVLEHMPEFAVFTLPEAEENAVFIPVNMEVSQLHADIFVELSNQPLRKNLLVERYGKHTTKAIDELIKHGIVKCEDDIVSLISDQVLLRSNQFLLALLQKHVGMLYLNEPGHNAQTYFFESTRECAIEVYDIYMNACRQVAEARKKHGNRGGYKIGFTTFITSN